MTLQKYIAVLRLVEDGRGIMVVNIMSKAEEEDLYGVSVCLPVMMITLPIWSCREISSLLRRIL